MTNLSETFSPKAIVTSYQKRGTMENFIKEAKDSFSFYQMKSHDYIMNEARTMISLLAYNLTNRLRTLSFLPTAKGIQIQTIHTRLIKVARKLVKLDARFTLNCPPVSSTRVSFGISPLEYNSSISTKSLVLKIRIRTKRGVYLKTTNHHCFSIQPFCLYDLLVIFQLIQKKSSNLKFLRSYEQFGSSHFTKNVLEEIDLTEKKTRFLKKCV